MARIKFSTLLLCFVLCSAQAYTQDEVLTGPVPLPTIGQSSKYMQGIADGLTFPSYLRVVGGSLMREGIMLKVILLDEKGNALGPQHSIGTWHARWGCRGQALTMQSSPVVEQTPWQSAPPLKRLHLMIDNSVCSQGIANEVLTELRNVLPGLIGNDSVAVSVFDHTTLEISPLGPSAVVAERCASTTLGPEAGIPAVYTCMLNGLRIFDRYPSQNNIMIVITASDDLASLGCSTSDVVQAAKEKGATVFIVKVGNSTRGYQYRHLSAATGGRMYILPSDKLQEIGPIVREILYSSKQFLEVLIPSTAAVEHCSEVLIHLGWVIEGGSPIADTFMLPIRDRSYKNTSAIVAAFADSTERGLREYYPILAIIAEELMADSTKRLRLTGHVSPDTELGAMQRGLRRAEHVAGYLKAYGVADRQLEVQSAGSSRPLYYLQIDEMQRLLNNRVEAEYIRPDETPYTIVVERVLTEEQAMDRVEWWSKKNYKAYFEPGVQNRRPVYDIVLWGYALRSEAEKAAKALVKLGIKQPIVR